MLTNSLKPRWQIWENLCLVQAFHQKIQLKVIGAALNKSLHAVSKKINRLGLREERHAPGRIKGDKRANIRSDLFQNLHKKEDIIVAYAPLSYTYMTKLTPYIGYWTIGKRPPLKTWEKGSCVGQLKQSNSAYSFVFPLNPTSLQDETLQNIMDQKRISYWKDEQRVSKTQALIIINKIRQNENLRPFHLRKVKSEP